MSEELQTEVETPVDTEQANNTETGTTGADLATDSPDVGEENTDGNTDSVPSGYTKAITVIHMQQ